VNPGRFTPEKELDTWVKVDNDARRWQHFCGQVKKQWPGRWCQHWTAPGISRSELCWTSRYISSWSHSSKTNNSWPRFYFL